MKRALLVPMAVYVSYMFGVASYMFGSRVKSLRAGIMKLKYFKTYQGEEPPERLILIADHYQNQFEVPVLFLITCASALAVDAVSQITVLLAWFFVFTRFVHAWVHLGRNNVRHRAAAFAFGWFTVVAMWVQILL